MSVGPCVLQPRSYRVHLRPCEFVRHRGLLMKTAGLGIAIALCGVAAACGGSDSKSPGDVGGPCYSNGTCNGGLGCYSNICVGNSASDEAGAEGGNGTSNTCTDYGTCETGCKCGSSCLPYDGRAGGHLCAYACVSDSDCQSPNLPSCSGCFSGHPYCVTSTNPQTTASICGFSLSCSCSSLSGPLTYGTGGSSGSSGGCTSNSDCSGCARCDLSTGTCVSCPVGSAGVCTC